MLECQTVTPTLQDKCNLFSWTADCSLGSWIYLVSILAAGPVLGVTVVNLMLEDCPVEVEVVVVRDLDLCLKENWWALERMAGLVLKAWSLFSLWSSKPRHWAWHWHANINANSRLIIAWALEVEGSIARVVARPHCSVVMWNLERWTGWLEAEVTLSWCLVDREIHWYVVGHWHELQYSRLRQIQWNWG